MKSGTPLKILSFGLAFLCLSSVWAADQDLAHGKRLAEADCAWCHAVGPIGRSTHPDAPPFRSLHLRYPIEDLEGALAEGISAGHPNMPEFAPAPIEALITYIRSLDG